MIDTALEQMRAWARDPAHGYDQDRRWGPDFDCSSAVIQAWENAGVPVRSRGATYTGNMYEVFTGCGFEDVTAEVELDTAMGMQAGDVLLNHRYHTAMYCGNGITVEASINENGGTTGGMSGDQSGREFLTRAYRNYPWDCVLRFSGTVPEGPLKAESEKPGTKPSYFYKVSLPLLKEGMECTAVWAVQTLLEAMGIYGEVPDCCMGAKTVSAVRAFQQWAGIEVDGEVGGQTWAALLKAG